MSLNNRDTQQINYFEVYKHTCKFSAHKTNTYQIFKHRKIKTNIIISTYKSFVVENVCLAFF